MQSLLAVLVCLCVCTYAAHTDTHNPTVSPSEQQQRCEALRSVNSRNHPQNPIQCTAGENCFSLDCTPTQSLAQLLNSEFHIYIEACKHPAAILVNASILNKQFSHEFTHSETIDLPHPSALPYTPKLAVMLDNSDSQVLVFSVVLTLLQNNYTLVPETRFPLNNVTCMNGHVVTHAHTTHSFPSASPTCIQTCAAVHKMVSRTNSLCHSSDDCLTVLCGSPSQLSVIDLTSSYTILPCQQPPIVEARFDDHTNNRHIAKNFTHNSTYPLFGLSYVKIQITLVDLDQYSILFGVNVLLIGSKYSLLPDQVIPIDRSQCPWYTGPTNNPLCATTPTQHIDTKFPHSGFPGHTTPTRHIDTANPTSVRTSVTAAASNSTGGPGVYSPDIGMLAGVIVGVILATALVIALSVGTTLAVVYFVLKKKSQGAYTYSQFRALEEDD